MHARWYKPDPLSLGFLIVSRVLEIRLWRAEIVVYWRYK
jgi:hypothetical protein